MTCSVILYPQLMSQFRQKYSPPGVDEEQVVRYPKSCCKKLANVITTTTGLRQYLKMLEPEPTLPTVEQWTKRQARSITQHYSQNIPTKPVKISNELTT